MLVRKSFGGGAGDFKADGSIAMTGPLSTNVGTFTSAVANGASAVAFDYNTPAYSTAGAMIARFKNNGVVKASVDKDGYLLAEKFSVTSTTSPFGWTEIRYGTNGWVFKSYAQDMLYVSGQNACINTQGSHFFGWAPSSAIEGVTADTRLYRGAAGRVDVCTTSTGTYGGLKAANFTLTVGGITSEVANGAAAKGFTFNTPAYTTTAKIASFANNNVEKAYIQQDGVFCSVGNGSETSPLFKGSAGRGFYEGAGGLVATDGTTALAVFSSSKFVWTAGAVIGFNVSGSVQTNQGVDTGLQRQAAGVWRINNGTAGTNAGTAFSTGSQTVAQLPAAATAGAGARAFVTDANSTTFLSIVAGGGANKVPVVSDGTNWLIG